VDKTTLDQHINIAAFAQLRTRIMLLSCLDYYVAFPFLLINAVGYLTHRKSERSWICTFTGFTNDHDGNRRQPVVKLFLKTVVIRPWTIILFYRRIDNARVRADRQIEEFVVRGNTLRSLEKCARA